MTRLNRTGAQLMHKYNARGATDVTGFGILGHANNLARNQRASVDFELHTLPIIKDMSTVASVATGFNLLDGLSAETSGGLLIALPADKAAQFIEEIQTVDEVRPCFYPFLNLRLPPDSMDSLRQTVVPRMDCRESDSSGRRKKSSLHCLGSPNHANQFLNPARCALLSYSCYLPTPILQPPRASLFNLVVSAQWQLCHLLTSLYSYLAPPPPPPPRKSLCCGSIARERMILSAELP